MAAKNNIKGITVEIGGETTGLDKALKDVNGNARDIQTELKSVEKLLKFDPKNVELLAQKQKLLGDSVETASKKLETLKDVQKQVNEQFKKGDIGEEAYRAFQREVASAEIELNKSETAIKNNGKAADDASGKFSNFGGALKAVAVGAGAAIAGMGAAAGGAVKGMTDMSVAGAANADNILTLSTQTGLSTDTLQEYSYAADLVDVSLETMTGSMAKQIKSMSSVATGNEAMSAAYKRLGIDAVDPVTGQLRDSETVYWELIDSLGQMEEGTDRDALSMQIFGKSAQELNPLIAQGSEGIAALSEEAHSMGAVLSDESLSAFGAFDDNIQKLTQGSSAAKNALGGVLLPQLNELSSVGVSLLGEFTSGMNAANGDMTKIGDVVSGVLSSAISSITTMLPEFINYGLEIVMSIVSAIGENIPTLMPAIISIVTTITEKLVESLPELLQMGIDILLALIDGITESLPELVPAVVEAILTIVQGLIDNLPKILEAALEIILALVEGLLAALPELIKALPAIITSIIDFVIGAIPDIIQAGITLFIALVEALPEIIAAIVEAIPLIIDGIINAVLDNLPLIIDAGISLFIALITNLPTIILEIVKAIPDILKGIVTAFTNPDNLKKMATVGLDLIMGLWNGINDAGAWLREKISEFFGGVVKGIKDFFGIKSPSALMRDEVGAYLAAGIGEGFTNQMKKVSKDMQSSIPTEFDTAVNAAYNASYGGGSTNTFDVTIPLSMNGKKVGKVVSRVQYDAKLGRARVLGVT